MSSSQDPNGKLGPGGVGVSAYVQPGATLAYRIDFENDAQASAPSQEVTLSDQLSSELAWQSFQVTEIGFGDVLIAVPANRQHFETNVLVTCCGAPFRVQMEAGIRMASGLVYASFRSLDPATGLPPAVQDGFLPPEDGTGRGQGHISYLVNARSDLATATEIRNVALIQFDRQSIIATNQRDPHNPAAGTDSAKEALNTIDGEPPSSAVVMLPPVETIEVFPVSWIGSDVGAGIANYDILVSTNGGPWGIWLAQTTNTTAYFQGQDGSTYGFYSIARDQVGWVEAAPPAADTVTRVDAHAPPPILSVSLATAPNGQDLLVNLTYPVRAGRTHTVEFRDDLGPNGTWQPLPGAPHNSGTVLDTTGTNQRYYRLRLE